MGRVGVKVAMAVVVVFENDLFIYGELEHHSGTCNSRA